MAKAVAKTETKRVQSPFPGVGLDLTPREHGALKAPYIALMCSIQGGITPYGPFLTEADARAWVAAHGEEEIYGHFDSALEPGVYFAVMYMQVPGIWNPEI